MRSAVDDVWTQQLQAEANGGFPEVVTRFGPAWPCTAASDNRVHAAVSRSSIAFADNETNYCARCQNGGNLLADRSLSRLFKSHSPRTLEELDELKRR